MIRAIRGALYAAAIGVLIASIVFVLTRGEVRCGMDAAGCWERGDWTPALGGGALAGMLAYVAAALGGRSHHTGR